MLVEKPIALNAAQAKRLAEAASRKGVMLMEAYWRIFCPSSTSSDNFSPMGRLVRCAP